MKDVRIGWPVAILAALSITSCARAADDADANTIEAASAQEAMPRFAEEGALLRPEGWEKWPTAGSSLGLTYSGGSMQMFHRVYMQPWAYDHVMENGEFAEGTMFVLAFFSAEDDANPARGGLYEGERASGWEVHLKWQGLNETGWGFYNFSDTTTSAQPLPVGASCYTCHAEHAATDHVFTQFYPDLRRRLAAEAGVPAADTEERPTEPPETGSDGG